MQLQVQRLVVHWSWLPGLRPLVQPAPFQLASLQPLFFLALLWPGQIWQQRLLLALPSLSLRWVQPLPGRLSARRFLLLSAWLPV